AGILNPNAQVAHRLLKSWRDDWSAARAALARTHPNVMALQYEQITKKPIPATPRNSATQSPPLLRAACTCGMNGCRFQEIPRLIVNHTSKGTSSPLIDQVISHRAIRLRLSSGVSRNVSAQGITMNTIPRNTNEKKVASALFTCVKPAR